MDNKIVWVISANFDYEPGLNVGIASSEEKAKAKAAKYHIEHPGYDSVTVKSFEVDADD
jgi:hypothetical protein